ncbi:MAG: transposase [Paludibacteraceae bacterium]|nr:transposase [Paludibacteraceae bacterium]
MAHVVLYYHIVWRTKRSEHSITEEYERELYAYIHGYCKEKQCTLIRIGGMSDHFAYVSCYPSGYSCK